MSHRFAVRLRTVTNVFGAVVGYEVVLYRDGKAHRWSRHAFRFMAERRLKHWRDLYRAELN